MMNVNHATETQETQTYQALDKDYVRAKKQLSLVEAEQAVF